MLPAVGVAAHRTDPPFGGQRRPQMPPAPQVTG